LREVGQLHFQQGKFSLDLPVTLFLPLYMNI
jgi:hypothetical protein